MKSLRVSVFRFSILLLLLSSLCCQQTEGPDSNRPVALVGPDQSARVGEYVILDGSRSQVGGFTRLTYAWSADSTNPAQPWFNATDSAIVLGLAKEGTYKFHLVVSAGNTQSAPDEVVITVAPRTEAVFADPVLEINVRWALRFPAGPIGATELSRLDTLVAGGVFGHISSLEGIEKCQNLLVLNLALHHISDIHRLAQLPNLMELELDQNRILSDISPLSGLTKLEILDLESNNITDITPLRNLTKLKFLGLLGNPITDITPLAAMSDLEQLWLGYYGAGTHPLAGQAVLANFRKLWLLWITGCSLENISFVSSMPGLRGLFIAFCQVRDLSPLASCPLLERLIADSNPISDLAPLEKLPKLNLLNFSFDQVTTLSPLVRNLDFGQGDGVLLAGNPLDSLAINRDIPVLRTRGAQVSW